LLGIDQPNSILVLCGDRRRVVGLDELYRVENQEKKAFRGEQAFTAAILDVSSPTKKKIYFLTGHGEMAVDDVSPARGLSALDAELKARNFAVDSLDLSLSRKIPDDAAVLVIVGQQGRFDAAEQELLRQYLSNRAVIRRDWTTFSSTGACWWTMWWFLIQGATRRARRAT
jgi:hypothetical protein